MSYTAAVITVSDLGSQGKRIDTSGPAVCAMLEGAGFSVVHTAIVPDEQEKIREALIDCADERHIGLIVTTGGTDFHGIHAGKPRRLGLCRCTDEEVLRLNELAKAKKA